MAARAEPDLARYLARSRRASRAAIGARRPARARSARQKGASRITATMSATKPPTSARLAPPPLPLLEPVYSNRNAATTKRTTPGIAERCTCFGGAGRPDRAATSGTLVIERAGREAAK